MNDKQEVSAWEQAWFLIRWATGYVIDLALLVGAIFGTATVALYFRNLGTINPFWVICISGAVFAAMMSGRVWARTQYFTHILPEIWERTIKDLVEKAKEDYEE